MKRNKLGIFGILILCCFAISFDSMINVQVVAALSVSDYFTLTYQINLSTSEVNEGQTFNALAYGFGTCKAALPISVSSAIIEGCIVATNQATGTQVTLNADYILTISPFPDKIGDTLQLTETIPLTFPPDSPPGIYIVSGKLIAVRINAVIWWDISGYLPSSQTIGIIKYDLNDSNSTTSSPATTPNPTSEIVITSAPLVVMPKSALFEVGSLNINPSTVKPEGKVNISLQITNTGDTIGTDTIILKINNQVENSKDVMLAGGESDIITFTTSHNLPGNYLVQVGGLNGKFTIVNTGTQLWLWLVIAVVIMLGVIFGLSISRFLRKKA